LWPPTQDVPRDQVAGPALPVDFHNTSMTYFLAAGAGGLAATYVTHTATQPVEW
jgi:hypothetical protein